MKVGLYLRVSTEQQIENYSIPLQKERMHAFCASKGWQEIKEYVDAGFSGSSLERPALKQLQQDIKRKRINVVMVYRLDRLSRSQQDTLYLIEDVFVPCGVEFISLSETIDTTTPFGRAMIGVLSVFAQLERETIVERFWSCHQKMVRDEGLWAGSACNIPYGYIRLPRGELMVNEKERQHVVRIFEEYVNLQSYAKVHQKLEAEGFPQIKNNRMRRLLENKLYTGDVSFSGEWFKGSHEPLVSAELFNTAQEVIQNNRWNSHGKAKNKVFTGKVFCGSCESEYRPYVNKKKHYLMCHRRKCFSQYESKCFNRTLLREHFEKEVFSRIQNLGTSGEISLENKANEYTKQIKQIDNKINKLLDLYMDDRVSKNTLDTKLNQLYTLKNERLEQLEELDDQQLEIQDFIKKGVENLSECDLPTRTHIVDLLIDKIVVTDETLQIVWKE
ncbi:hypothetical protein GMB80_13615 [Turicibacter sanguinis]|nr:hypothetical protein [Turicibacter sanguinis]